MAFAALSVGAPSMGVIAILAIVLGTFDIRRLAIVRHQREIAQLKVNEAATRVEAIKAQYRALLTTDQPSLPLQRPPGRPPRR